MAIHEQTVQAVSMPHTVVLENRKHLSVTGVEDVDSFDEQTVILYTQQGELTVKGDDLHIQNLNVQVGEIAVEGDIVSLSYVSREPKSQNSSFFGRVFR